MALVFFVIGVAIAFVILPFASQFLLQFVPAGVERNINIRSYFDFITSLFLAFGVLMEFPILLVGLSKVGIVTSERLRRTRRMTILGIAVFSAVVTPGGDLVSPFVLGVTLYVLYEGTIVFIRRTGR
jgi:sec-independent protein translocase protein TatC